ncbi:MAG: HNH endonuclease [Plesiomonas sp.]|uniref:HNH endonuclease n=1 Tax=Plesiomonas sp. TaxID=2486279 RepID=UPI003F348B3A
MPPRTPRACRTRGCANTTIDNSGLCDSHKGQGWVAHSNGRTATQRGYGSRWRALRQRVLKRDQGLCVMCRLDGLAVPATDVDHIIAKAHGGGDTESNLQSLCRKHHAKKTALERSQVAK